MPPSMLGDICSVGEESAGLLKWPVFYEGMMWLMLLMPLLKPTKSRASVLSIGLAALDAIPMGPSLFIVVILPLNRFKKSEVAVAY